jgi:cardiolipin synthase (CMP-forming)
LRQIPNLLSFLRLICAPITGWLILRNRLEAALLLSCAAGVTDWIDGYVARRLGAMSKIGSYLDPAADKLLLVIAFVSLGVIGLIPDWLVLLVVARDLVIVIGVALLWKLRGRTEFTPLLSGKLSTAFQIFTVLAVLVGTVFPFTGARILRDAGIAGTLLFTLVSGLNYVRKGIKMAARESLRESST